jgi:hypothetical protein
LEKEYAPAPNRTLFLYPLQFSGLDIRKISILANGLGARAIRHPQTDHIKRELVENRYHKRNHNGKRFQLTEQTHIDIDKCEQADKEGNFKKHNENFSDFLKKADAEICQRKYAEGKHRNQICQRKQQIKDAVLRQKGKVTEEKERYQKGGNQHSDASLSSQNGNCERDISSDFKEETKIEFHTVHGDEINQATIKSHNLRDNQKNRARREFLSDAFGCHRNILLIL